MDKITPKEVRYIKLGSGGKWVRTSFARGEVHFGYSSVPHEPCAAGDWDAVAALLRQGGRNPAKVKDGVREIRDFYTLGSDCLWITFANGRLWWCFADPAVTWLGAADDDRGSRMRRTVSGWRDTSLTGEVLQVERLSSRLTQVAAYRQTICRVKAVNAQDYLLRRINGIEEPLITRANAAKAAMVAVASDMIAQLHWADFETLVDLIFGRTGWQRVSRVGGTQKDIDLVLQQPTTGELVFVQVKSKATQAVLDDYIERFRASGVYDRMFFMCHSPTGALSTPEDQHIHVLTGASLTNMAINAGLLDWLAERVA
jgi:Restriction endonuclease